MQTDVFDKTGVFEYDKIDEREHQILEACRSRDLAKLRDIAESPGGFMTDTLRQSAWPVLLGVPPSAENGTSADSNSWKNLPSHRQEHQVQLDVDRAFVHYPEHKSEAERNQQKTELSDLILEVLRRHPYLHYFQGYHDICQVFLLVLPQKALYPAVSRLSALRIRDFHLPTISASTTMLFLIPDILRAADPALAQHLSDAKPFFALADTLTMYAHNITTLGEISRLFDVLLAREPVFSVYMFAAIVRSRREELFETEKDEPEMLHSILSKLPKPLKLEAIIHSACELFDAHPPETLPSWRAISRVSVLKTARNPYSWEKQTMADGEEFFNRHAKELDRREKWENTFKIMRRYQQPARLVGVAVLVGLVAYLIRKPSGILGVGAGPGPMPYLSALLARWTR
ncbi:GTPase-activating protein gyp10 [Naviculisporaceae sp. PSN 640]